MQRTMTIALVLLSVGVAGAQTLYVDNSSAGGGAGSIGSLANPHVSLRAALVHAAADPAITRIEVAEGTYKPGPAMGDSFDLVSNVEVVGGYMAGSGFAVRDAEAHVTVLSGAIGLTGPEDNTRTVVRAVGVAGARLDGFHIRRGYGGEPIRGGAGLYVCNSTLLVISCVFSNNSAPDGGAVFVDQGVGMSFSNCTFRDNSATGMGAGGGALMILSDSSNNGESEVLMLRCRFLGNSSDGYGGAINNIVGDLGVWNSAFSGNVADQRGGAVAVSGYPSTTNLGNCSFTLNSASEGGALYCSLGSLHVTNSILWDDSASSSGDEVYTSASGTTLLEHSCIAGAAGLGGTGNFDEDPNFLDADGDDDQAGNDDDDLRIPHPALDDSPCVDAGDNYLIGGAHLQLDLAGDTRIQHPYAAMPGSPVADVGAYEVAPIVVFYPGSGDDLWLRIHVNGIATSLAGTDVVALAPGDRVSVSVTSPEGSYDMLPAVLIGMEFVDGVPPDGIGPAFPEVHVNLSGNIQELESVPATAISDQYIPPGLSGSQLMLQAFVLHPSAPNGIFVATNGREVRFL